FLLIHSALLYLFSHLFFFFFMYSATTEIYTLSLHDALPIFPLSEGKAGKRMFDLGFEGCMHNGIPMMYDEDCPVNYAYFINDTRSEEHTSELQSRRDLVCRLLLEKKKKK